MHTLPWILEYDWCKADQHIMSCIQLQDLSVYTKQCRVCMCSAMHSRQLGTGWNGWLQWHDFAPYIPKRVLCPAWLRDYFVVI